jgi:adenosine deaminase
MFQTTLTREYIHAQGMGLTTAELLQIAEASFRHSFLPAGEKRALLEMFRSSTATLGLV